MEPVVVKFIRSNQNLTKDQAYLSFVLNEIQNNQTKIDNPLRELTITFFGELMLMRVSLSGTIEQSIYIICFLMKETHMLEIDGRFLYYAFFTKEGTVVNKK